MIGSYFYASRDESGAPIITSGQKPIEFLQSTLDPNIELLNALWNAELAKIKEILGVNDAVDASQPDKRALVGVQQQAFAAHKTAIRNLQNAYLDIMREICEKITYIYQVQIKEGKLNAEMRDLLSEPEFESLNLKEFGELMFNISIRLLPDQYEQQALIQETQLAIQAGLIGVDDSMMIRRVSKESIEKAEEILRMRIERRKREAAESEQARMQAEQQSIQMKLQMEGQLIQMQEQAKAQTAQIIEQAKSQNIILQVEEKRKTLTLEYDLKEELIAQAAEVKAQYDFDKDEESSAPKAAGNIEPDTRMTVS
jgi:hypothetical protein